MSQLESKVQAKILKELKSLNIYAHKNITTNKKGVPDIIACYKGYYLAIEVKAKGGKTTELQDWNIEQIKKSGGSAIVAYGWEDVAEELRIIDEKE